MASNDQGKLKKVGKGLLKTSPLYLAAHAASEKTKERRAGRVEEAKTKVEDVTVGSATAPADDIQTDGAVVDHVENSPSGDGGQWWAGISKVTIAANVQYLNVKTPTKSMGLGILKVTEEGIQWRGNLGFPKIVMPWSEIEAIAVDGEVTSRVKASAVLGVGLLGLGSKKRREDTHISVITSKAEYGFLVAKAAPEVVRTKLRPVLRALEATQEPTGLTTPPVATSTADELVKLADLRESGALTADEFAAAKARLLGI
jgi:hypothetical protein